MLSVPAKSNHLGLSAYEILKSVMPEIRCVHRLDYETSGIMVFARGKLAERFLFEQFRNRLVEKKYQALCLNVPKIEQGIFRFPLSRESEISPRQSVDHASGKEATTHWSINKSAGSYWLADLKPTTGRTHQLRVHLSHSGSPIVNDPLYGDTNQLEFNQQNKQMYLHASSLKFNHPVSGKALHFQSDSNFSEFLQRIAN